MYKVLSAKERKCYERGNEWGVISSQEIVGIFVEEVAFQCGLRGWEDLNVWG